MEHGVLTIIEGGAVGADTFAGEWTCIQRSCQLVTEYANWENMADPPDRSAIRRCSTITRPNLVVAFPGGRGTADMVLKARRAGIEVIQIPSDRRHDPAHDTGSVRFSWVPAFEE